MYPDESVLSRELIRQVVEDTAVARGIMRAARVDTRLSSMEQSVESLLESGIVDDGTPPQDATDVLVEPGRRTLTIYWGATPEEDYVDHALIRLTNQTDFTETLHRLSLPPAQITDLDSDHEYAVEVKMVDEWGRESENWQPVPPVTVTPEPSVADYVDLAGAEIAGKLGWQNIEQINDDSMFAEDVLTSKVFAAQDTLALKSWIGLAAIDNALIADLEADKITTGYIRAARLNTTGQIEIRGSGAVKVTSGGYEDTETGQVGSLRPDGTNANYITHVELDTDGISLRPTPAETELPSTARASKITPFLTDDDPERNNPWAGQHFYRTSSGTQRGFYIGAYGYASLGTMGAVSFDAYPRTPGSGSQPTPASLKIQAKYEGVNANGSPVYTRKVVIDPLLEVNGVLDFSGVNANLLGRVIGQDNVKDAAIDTRQMRTNSVTATILGSIEGSRAVTTGAIQDGQITKRTIGANEVGSSEIGSGQVLSGHIANGTLSPGDFAPRSVDAGALAFASVSENHCQAYIVSGGAAQPSLRRIDGSGTGLAAAAWNHGHGSVNFKTDYTPQKRRDTVKMRAAVRQLKHADLAPEMETVVDLLLDITHQLIDDPHRAADETVQMFDRDRDFRHDYLMDYDPLYYAHWMYRNDGEYRYKHKQASGGTDEMFEREVKRARRKGLKTHVH